jgi:hypothetical protein
LEDSSGGVDGEVTMMSGNVTGANGGVAGERGAEVSGAERVGDEVREGGVDDEGGDGAAGSEPGVIKQLR